MITRTATLGQKDIVLYTVSAILLLETLTAAAAIGTAAVFWWLLLGVLFFVPFALICAEMGCTYPEEGGIYAWVRDAFGGRWGARASWGYWVNTSVWLPAIYVLFAGIFTQLFAPGLPLWGQIGIGIVLAWLTVLLNAVTLDIGKWVPNAGAVVKVLVFLAIIVGAVLHTREHGSANELTLATLLVPDWSASLEFIPAIVYGMLGFELVSASSEEMKNPARDVPRGVLISGLIIISLYTMATVALLAALPVAEVDLVEGLMATLQLFFGTAGWGGAFVTTLGVMALYTFFANGVTWALGCNRAAAEAALERELPKVFALESRRGTPIGAAVIMGTFSTLALLLYGFMARSSAELFWSLFAFSAVIFLLPYLGMVLAFLKQRTTDAERYRPFRIPGGMLVARLCALACFLILALCIVLFVYTPGDGIQWPVFLGAVFTVALGEAVIRLGEHR